MIARARFIPLFATLFVIGVNSAANILPINGYETGELSKLNPTGLTPAGWAFSIWGLIYFGLLSYALSRAFGSEDVRQRAARFDSLYLLNAAANIGWIFAWHYRNVALSFVFMLLLLATLTAIAYRLRHSGIPTRTQLILIDAPFSVYLGWISTATLLNLSALFFNIGAYPFGMSMDEWALTTLTLAVVLYVWVGLSTGAVLYCLVFIWAGIGIAQKSEGISGPVQTVALTGVVAVMMVIGWILVRKYQPFMKPRSNTTRA